MGRRFSSAMAPHATSLLDLSTAIQARVALLGGRRAALIGLSGIDGSGKGYLAAHLDTHLRAAGLRTALLNVDGWLNLPQVRFAKTEPAHNFYTHALRLEALFTQLIVPLRTARGIDLVADFAEETATAYRPHRYRFAAVDVIVLDGIYLFKRAYRSHFDIAVWIDCSFRTALARAVARGQEGLAPDATVEAYETIYFPAQRIHFERDQPRDAADYVLMNDTLPTPLPGPTRARGAERGDGFLPA